MSLLLFVFFKGNDKGNVASTSPYLRGHWRSGHGVRTLGIVLQNIFELTCSEIVVDSSAWVVYDQSELVDTVFRSKQHGMERARC